MALEDQLYFCATDNNSCDKREDCYRYTKLKENNKLRNATLCRAACTEDNGYVLFIQDQNQKKENEHKAQNQEENKNEDNKKVDKTEKESTKTEDPIDKD